MKTLIISLKDSIERKQHIQREFSKSTISRQINFFNGIDGSLLEKQLMYRNRISQIKTENEIYYYDANLRLNGEGLKNGELGCLLSHITIYKLLLLDKENDRYLVFEDDVKFNAEEEVVKDFLKNLPDSKDYDLAHLCESDWFPFLKDSNENSHYFRPMKNFFNRLTAYVITKRGAQKLLSAVYPCIGVPADDLVSNTFVFSNNFKVIVPESKIPLFINSPDLHSKINEINKKII